MSAIKKIRFQGRDDLILIAGGAIATEEDYRHFRPAYAHLFPDGRVMRYGQQIGARVDIEILGPSDAEPTDDAMERMLQWLIGDS